MKDERIQRLNALKLKYESEIAAAKVDIENYLNHSVGVAEHPHLIESLDGLVSELSTSEDRLNCLKDNFLNMNKYASGLS